MKLTGAAILVSRGMKVLQAAPAAYPYRSAAWHWGFGGLMPTLVPLSHALDAEVRGSSGTTWLPSM